MVARRSFAHFRRVPGICIPPGRCQDVRLLALSVHRTGSSCDSWNRLQSTSSSDAIVRHEQLLADLRALPAEEQDAIWQKLREDSSTSHGAVSSASSTPASAVASSSSLDESSVASPEWLQLRRYFLAVSIPYVGFGFADNFLMIVAGEQLELQLGGIFHLSTMAAAGFGNLFSDIVGLGLGGAIERGADRLGIPPHGLSEAQQGFASVRRTHALAAILGISAGCILGMCPLLFEMDGEEKKLVLLFKNMDTDRSGRIDEEELRTAFGKCNIFLSRAEVNDLMRQFDKDGDGEIDYAEFKAMVQSWTSKQQEKFFSQVADSGLSSAQ